MTVTFKSISSSSLSILVTIHPTCLKLYHHLWWTFFTNILAPIPRNIWHSLTYSDAFQHHLQTAVNLNEFQYETLLLACGILQRYGDNLVFSRRHLDSLKVQLQENLELFFNQTKIHVNERTIYFICIGRPRHPNPKTQMRDNNIRLLRPRAAILTPQQRNQILLLCDERLPPPPEHPLLLEPEPPLIDGDEDNNELEDIMEVEEHVGDEIDDEEQNLHSYQLTIFYQNKRIRFDEAFQQWANEHYESERRNFEQQQEHHYDQALLLADGQQRQRNQIEYIYVPLEAVDENIIINEVANNDNIIINEVDNDDIIIINEVANDDIIINNDLSGDEENNIVNCQSRE